MSSPVDPTAPVQTGTAAFLADNGDGTATLMKPKKPTIHHRGGDTHYNIDGKKIDNGDTLDEEFDDDETINEFKASKWHIVSASVFVFSSLLYLAMACMVMDTYWFYKDVPRNVYNADDDAAWWNYFVNCTDDAFFPQNVSEADDDYTWDQWYNEEAFAEDDIVWLPRIANENAPGYEPYVSKYMLVYFWAAFGFLITGVIEIILARKAPLMVKVLYYMMMLAAIFGLISAILTNKSPFWSNITNCISVNIWALEAIFIVMQRVNGTSDAAYYDGGESIFCWSIIKWFWIADFSFLIGTFGDAISSYFYIFQYDNHIMGIFAIIFASCWQICAFIYLSVAIYDYKQFKSYFGMAAEYEQELKEMEAQGIVVEGGPANGSDGAGLPAKEISLNNGSSPPSSNVDPPKDEENKADNVVPDREKDVEATAAAADDNEIPRSSTNDLLDEACCTIPTTL